MHHDLQFSLTLPAGWTHSFGEKVGSIPLDVVSRNTPENGFAANIVVAHSDHSGPEDMTEALALYQQSILNQFPEIQFLAEAVEAVDTVAVGKLTYSGTVLGREQTTRELLVIRNGQDLQISFSDLSPTFEGRTEFASAEASLAWLD